MSTVRVLYVATDENRCAHAAHDIEHLDPDLKIVGATSAAGVETALEETEVDCLVFAENPLTSAGAQLDAVATACQTIPEEPVPIVLFTDDSYGPTTAKATEAVADYVCSDAEDAYEHLVDRIHWNTSAGTDGDDDGRYETLVESMEEGVLVFEGDCWVRYGNDAIADVFGLNPDGEVQFQFRALAERGIVSEDDAETVAAAVDAVTSGETDSRTPEITVDPLDADETRVVEFQVVPLPGEDEGALATVRTVTEYKRAETALEETRTKIERLHGVTDRMGACRSESELFEHAADALELIVEPDVCGVETLEDDCLAPVATRGGDYGPTTVEEDVGGRALQEGSSVLVEEGVEEPIPDAESMLCVPVDGVALLRAGESAPSAFDDRDRDLVELLAAHVGEALTRIRVGRTLRERERDLIAERERLVGLFENVPNPVVSYEFEDGRPVIRDANPSFEATFGIDADVAVGDFLDEHVRAPAGESDVPDDGGFVSDDRRDLYERLRSGETVERIVRRETDEGPRDFLVHAGALEGHADEGYLVYTDITDQKVRQRELERESDRLDRIADLLEGPLQRRINEARGNLELAAETGDPDDVAEVKRAHEGISRLAADLRHLARQDLESDLDPEPLGIENAATHAWASVETGSADLSVEHGTVVADRDRIGELLERLFRTSMAHAPADGRSDDPVSADLEDESTVTVAVGLLDDDGFYVADDGDGLDPGERATLESGSGSDAGEETDVGLGLDVVRRIADAHDWTVAVGESGGGGTRVEFRTGRSDDLEPGSETGDALVQSIGDAEE